MARPCAGGHCSARSQELNEFCKIIYQGAPNGYAGKPVASQDQNGPCFCTCSCVALGTIIATGSGDGRAVESINVGDTILACGEDLKWTEVSVNFSGGTGPNSTQDDAIYVRFDGGDIVVTSDHLFLTGEKKLCRADRLHRGATLMKANGSAAEIQDVRKGYFEGGFHYIATNKDDPGGKLDGHLIDTAGVISADYTVQLYGDQFVSEEDESLPVVGTRAYADLYGHEEGAAAESYSALVVPREQSDDLIIDEALLPPSDITLVCGPGGARKQNVASGAQRRRFVEGGSLRLSIPDGACRFIPDDEAEAKSRERMRSGLAALASREEAEGLVYHFHAYYPDVFYHIDWNDNTVNAYAWVQNGNRHVALLGGLIRYWSIEWEAVALVLGHELAHHYGGPPTYSHGLSCEGQADYIGAGAMMRRVFFGETYVSTLNAAINQLQGFFGTRPPGWGCGHPSVECRTDIYTAAMTLDPIPGCAHATSADGHLGS